MPGAKLALLRKIFKMVVPLGVNVYAIIIVLCISLDKSIIRTRSLRNTHSQETTFILGNKPSRGRKPNKTSLS
jgi:hypothetical protein